ncbi:MAG TPA: hypothetical protein VMZ06_11115 [Candidatus Bathyarchaeia archaeon]|nr:hypothetical protein [Candidatus Bathyarchaeia archaeon]
MLIPFSGGECIDDLAVLRADQGLERLLRRKVMAPSTGHDFLRRIQYVGLEGLGGVRRRQLACIARRLWRKINHAQPYLPILKPLVT